MTTSAISGLSASLYRDDPETPSVTFTNVSLVDSGDHIHWQAPRGYRYWDSTYAVTIEKQVGGAGDWINITSQCQINYLRGRITVDNPLGATDLVRASGKRRDESDFIKIANLYDAKLTINGSEIDITSCEDEGWGATMASFLNWELTAEAYYYAIEDHASLLSEEIIAKIYAFNRQGYHTSDFNPSTDIGGSTDDSFKIQLDDEPSPSLVTLTVSGKNSGALIASEMQSKIRALGAPYDTVTVKFLGDRYKIISGTRGPTSKVRILNADTKNIADSLKIGTENGGINTDGSAYSFVGKGALNSIENMVANPNDAQKETLTFKGRGEIYPEN